MKGPEVPFPEILRARDYTPLYEANTGPGSPHWSNDGATWGDRTSTKPPLLERIGVPV